MRSPPSDEVHGSDTGDRVCEHYRGRWHPEREQQADDHTRQGAEDQLDEKLRPRAAPPLRAGKRGYGRRLLRLR